MESPTLIADCPNPACNSRHQGFKAIALHSVRGFERQLIIDIRGRTVDARATNYVVFACSRCDAPLIVELANLDAMAPTQLHLQLTKDYVGKQFAIIRMYPEPEQVEDVPDHVPDNVATPYNGACRSLKQGDFDVAGMGFRRSLDVATKHLLRELKPSDLGEVLKKPLYQRIERLHKDQRITADIKDWAHIVRDEGNDAAHDEAPYTKEAATELHGFARVLLMYVFTMPKLVEKYRPAPPSMP